MKKIKGVVIGAGFFSDFHYDAWSRMDNIEIVALSDLNLQSAKAMQSKYGIAKIYTDNVTMVDTEKPDFIDIVTPPASHYAIIKSLVHFGLPIICQKALAPTFDEANEIVNFVNRHNIRFMVHENFRFQPWHRAIKDLIEQGTIGKPHNFYFQSRMGDGYGNDAYLSRQPYFRDYPRLLIYETGIHFIDTFRFLSGEVKEVYAKLKKLNHVIKGEDTAIVNFTFENGAWATWDAGRYNEDTIPNRRYTFGTFLVEGTEGSIRLDLNGKITIQPLGQPIYEYDYHPSALGFAGDCCFATQKHFIDCIQHGKPFETSGDEYIKSLKIQEMIYRSSLVNLPIFK